MARILVIEDNPVNMRLTVTLLQREGHEILEAADAEEGIRLARVHLPQLILMDVQLPGMDGLAASRLLKADAATHGIKIVALTALAMAGDRERVAAAGCDGYISKPIRYREFLKVVGEMVAGEPQPRPADTA
jgi:two-component system cell cycle response regulator DivK